VDPCHAGEVRSRVGAAAGILTLVVFAAACAPPSQSNSAHALRPSGSTASSGAPTTSTTRAASTAVTTTTAALPLTPLSWSPCDDGLQCATLVVPLDYSDPRGPTLPIAVARHVAEDPAARIGSLVIDPGGPGVSGVTDMANELSALTPRLLDDFDIVMFDPRGVGESDPVTCGEMPGSTPATGSDPVPVTLAQQAADISGLKQFAAACEKASANILPHVGTVDVARDMDRLRAALGNSGLSYMGQSYGSLLGLVYASLFPTHVRAMVLDGVIDPALSFDQMTQGQAAGFENVLDQFFTWCAGTSSCAWRPSGDPTSALLALIRTAQVSPVAATGGRTAGAGELYDALLGGLYARVDWPQLGDALAAQAAGEGSGVVAMSDHYNRSGSPNADDAALAVDCLDHPVSRDPAAFASLARSLTATAPVFGPLLAWGEAACSVWPAPPTRVPGPVAAAGSPPILVVGTTADPATPYAWAVSASHELSHGVLLTRDGDDHVAYFYSACVRADVEDYLTSGSGPAPGTVCPS
jgi:pimeloyl-ACP methyl ester carboxylesterase